MGMIGSIVIVPLTDGFDSGIIRVSYQFFEKVIHKRGPF